MGAVILNFIIFACHHFRIAKTVNIRGAPEQKFQSPILPEPSTSREPPTQNKDRYCEIGNLKTIADPEAYMIRLRFIAGLQNSENKLKVLEHLQQNPHATIDILLVIQQREQTVQFVNNQNEPNETISFARNGQLRKKTTGNGKISTGFHNKVQECSKCGTKHEPRSCPAFGRTCNNWKKPNHLAKVCRVKKQTNHFVGKEANFEENHGSTSDYSYFLGIPTISRMVQWRKSK